MTYQVDHGQIESLTFSTLSIDTSCSDGTSLSGFLDEGLQKLLLADSTIVVLVHGIEVLLEGSLVELGVWLDTQKHAAAEFADLSFL